MRGRKPRPTKVKILEGEKNKNRINKREPQPSELETTPPKHLSPEAKNEWKRIYPELQRMGLMACVDRAALAAYCQAYGRWVKYEKIVADKGELYQTQSGNIITSPALWVANKALEQMHKFLTEFGLTPASRSRIQINPAKKKDDMEELLDFCVESTRKTESGKG